MMLMYFPADEEGDRGARVLVVPQPLQRRGLVPSEPGLPAGGAVPLRAAGPHPRVLPRAAHPLPAGRRCALARVHAGGRARPQQRRGRHPAQIRLPSHVPERRHQTDRLHHRRPHRQAHHAGVKRTVGGASTPQQWTSKPIRAQRGIDLSDFELAWKFG